MLIKYLKHFIGVLIFATFNRVEIRYLVPLPILVKFVEKLRCYGLNLMGMEIGVESYVRKGLFVTSPNKVSIGSCTKIGPNSELWSYGCISIGDNVEIGSRLVIHTDEHMTADVELPLAKQGGVLNKVIIKDDVYMGSCVVILSGVTIESRVVVAAGAVVTKNLKSGYVYAGVPAKAIKEL